MKKALKQIAKKMQVMGLKKQANKLYAIANGEMPPRVKKLVDKKLNPKKFKSVSQNDRVSRSDWWEQVLYAANELMEAHGVESIVIGPNHDPFRTAMYVNMGDPYISTLIYDESTKEFTWEGQGDWQERVEAEVEEETGMRLSPESGEWEEKSDKDDEF